ncbi:ribonuclease P protein component [Candidatus Dojkabacteria bacterium]|nr:ribonuclease P protein component [Candidatus Dojkabacteria bacterium]
MLSANNRLKKSSQFNLVYKKGVHLRGYCGKLIILKRLDEDPYRIGIVTSSKLGKAHVRNKIRRQIRSIFHKNSNLIPQISDIIYLVWNGKATYSQFEKDIKYLLIMYKNKSR